MSIIKHVTLQKIVAHDFRYDTRKLRFSEAFPLPAYACLGADSGPLANRMQVVLCVGLERHTFGRKTNCLLGPTVNC